MTMRTPNVISALALTVALAAPALAQDAAAPAEAAAAAPAGLDEIVVTARKVSENLQDVPVAVTAFSGAALQQQSARQVSDIAKLTPGLVIREASSAGTAATFQIRGQFQNDVLATLDPSVGVYVDGLYWSRAYGINSDLLDVRSAQTLKGPQGTLFGRNTTGGAILIETNNPELDSFSGSLSGTYGRFDDFSGTAIANIPIVPGKVALRAAFTRRKSDGYIHELNSGATLGEKDSWTGRAKLLAQFTDNLSLLLSGEIYKTDFLNRPYRALFLAPASPGNIEAGGETLGLACFANLAACAGAGITAYTNAIRTQNDDDTLAINLLPRTYAKTQTYGGTLNLDTFFGAIKFVGGYRKVRSFADLDLDGSPFRLLETNGSQNLKQYSGELQFTGKALDDKLDFAAGAFYFHESGLDQSLSTAIPLLNPNNPNVFAGNISTDSQGLYGQATYHFTDKLSFTGGLRYSIEDKGITLNNRNFIAGTGFVCSLTACPSSKHNPFDGVSYTAGLDYKFTPDILGYIKTAKGFRSGGQNLRAIGALSGFQPFKPETATSYEAGVKSEFLDRRVRLNVAGYYTKVNDIQRSTIVAVGTQTATVLGNAGRADISGGEAELDALLFDGFRLGATAAYTDPKYKSYIDPNSGFDRSHERFDNTPKWTWTVSGTYSHEFDFGKFMIRGDYIWQDTTALQIFNYYTDSAGATRDASNGALISLADAKAIKAATTMKSVGLVNARASLSFAQDRYEIAVFGRNLTNNRGVDQALFIPAPFSSVSGQRREPRTWGITGTVRFGQ